MTPIQVVSAYKAINELTSVVLPYHATRSLTILKKELADEFETVATMERNLIEECGGEMAPDGTFHFPNEADTEEFMGKYNALMHQDDDVKLPVADLSKYTDMIRISSNAVEALDGLVVFEPDGTKGE